MCTRIVAPAGGIRLAADGLIYDPGLPDPTYEYAQEHAVQSLPYDALVYLLGSRYCETEKLLDFAWSEFGHLPNGWAKVEAIVQYTHNRIKFSYPNARSTRTAYEGWQEGIGVCRDYAHLALTLCRCMNIPARYCTGYLGDIGVPPDTAPMDFSGWFQAYLGGRWYTFDARHGRPRIGRILIAVGRDAADVAISTIFGPSILKTFKVITEETKEYA
jgi:transglutaminase-like putative cysteine protease